MKANLSIIEEKRQKVGIPMSLLARRVGLKSHQALRFWLESGRQLNIDLERVEKLCAELGIKEKDVIK